MNDKKKLIAATVVFAIGVILALIANFLFKDVHVPTLVDAFELLGSEKQTRVLFLWICALLGVLFQGIGTFMIGKISYTNLSYYGEVKMGFIYMLIAVAMAIITCVSAYYTSLAVMGLLIGVGLLWLFISSDSSNNKSKKRR